MSQTASTFTKVLTCIALLAFLSLIPVRQASAQIGDLGKLLEGGKADAEMLISEYMKPFGSGFGAGINSGWTDRASTHGVPGFHLKINASMAMVPNADLSFNVNDIGLNELVLIDGDPNTSTFSGGSSNTVIGLTETFNNETYTLSELKLPGGIDFNYIPTPMIQAGAGLPKNTEVMLRLIPPTDLGDYGEISLFGMGLKHELNQWLPGGRFWPVTVSVMGGYTTFRSGSEISFAPSGNYSNPDPQNVPDDPNDPFWDNQDVSLQTDAFTMNILVGRSLPIISAYAGVGFETSTTSIKMEGNYPYYTPNPDYSPGGNEPRRELRHLVDPIDLSIDGSNTMRALVGVRLSPLPFLTLNVDYTLADYSLVTAGFGFSFR